MWLVSLASSASEPHRRRSNDPQFAGIVEQHLPRRAERRPMKVFLRHRQNGSYLHSNGREWTTEPTHARHFCSTTEAAQVCARERIGEVEILLKFGQERHDIRMVPPADPENLRFHIPAMFMS